MTIDLLKVGEHAIITEIKDDTVLNELQKIGFFIGDEIIVQKIAPFGSPISIKTDNIEVAIRKEIAILIETEPIS